MECDRIMAQWDIQLKLQKGEHSVFEEVPWRSEGVGIETTGQIKLEAGQGHALLVWAVPGGPRGVE